MSGQLHATVTLPRERTPVSVGQEAGWTLEKAWILRKRETLQGYEMGISRLATNSLYRLRYPVSVRITRNP